MKLDKVAIWDTYITEEDGNILHFDIVVPEGTAESKVKEKYLKDFIRQKGITGKIRASKCDFCHVQTVTEEQKDSIHEYGFYVIPLGGF